jgi:hypothetical protein
LNETPRLRLRLSGGGVWWIKFYDRTGRARRESSGSEVKGDAEKVLGKRLGEVASGKRLIGSDLERTTFEDLAAMIGDDYRAENRRSTHRLEIGLKRLGERLCGLARAISISRRYSHIAYSAKEVARLPRQFDGSLALSVARFAWRRARERPNARRSQPSRFPTRAKVSLSARNGRRSASISARSFRTSVTSPF